MRAKMLVIRVAFLPSYEGDGRHPLSGQAEYREFNTNFDLRRSPMQCRTSPCVYVFVRVVVIRVDTQRSDLVRCAHGFRVAAARNLSVSRSLSFNALRIVRNTNIPNPMYFPLLSPMERVIQPLARIWT